jgi:hypothetical protein
MILPSLSVRSEPSLSAEGTLIHDPFSSAEPSTTSINDQLSSSKKPFVPKLPRRRRIGIGRKKKESNYNYGAAWASLNAPHAHHFHDCMNYLRNVWFGNGEKALTKDLNVHLRASLDEIDPKLRVTASMSAIIRAVDKEFSLSANYPKGHGKIFLEWIREYYPVFYYCTLNEPLDLGKICAQKDQWRYT